MTLCVHFEFRRVHWQLWEVSYGPPVLQKGIPIISKKLDAEAHRRDMWEVGKWEWIR